MTFIENYNITPILNWKENIETSEKKEEMKHKVKIEKGNGKTLIRVMRLREPEFTQHTHKNECYTMD